MKKILKKILIYAPLFALSACQNTASVKALIPEKKLIDVLVDVHTAEALTEGESQKMRDSMARVYYAQIYEKYGVTKTDFDSTIAVYTRNPVQMDSLYSQVMHVVRTKKAALTH